MGVLNSNSKPKMIDNDHEGDEYVISFIEFSLVGNFYEADKVLKQIKHHRLQIVNKVIEVVKRTTREANATKLRNLRAINQQADKIIDLAAWQKMQSLDDVFGHLRSEIQKLLPKHQFYINELNPTVKALFDYVWVGKHVVEACQHIKSGQVEKFSIVTSGALGIDSEVYEIVSSFFLLMVNIRSFMMIRRIFDGDVAPQFLTHQYTDSKYCHQSFDRAFPQSANLFSKDLECMLKKIKQLFSLWKQLYKLYLSKEYVSHLKPNQKQQFNVMVNRINQLVNTKLSDRSIIKQAESQICMNGVPDKPVDNSLIVKLEEDNQSLKEQIRKVNAQIKAKDLEHNRQINQLKQKHEKELEQKNKAIEELRRLSVGKASAPSIQEIKAQLKYQYEQKVKRDKQEWYKNQLNHIKEVTDSLTKGKNQIYDLLNQSKSRFSTYSAKRQPLQKKEQIKIEQLAKQVEKTFKDIKRQVEIFIKQKQEEIDNLHSKIAQLEAEIKILKLKIEDNQKDKNRYKTEITNKDKLISQKIQQIEIFEKENSDLKDKNKTMVGKIEDLEREIKKTSIELQQKLSFKDNNIRQLKKQIDNLNFDYTKKCEEIEKMTIDLKKFSRCYTQYFNGNILNINTNDHLQWFVKNLEGCTKKRIRATYPLYRFDRDNKTSFHNYIDNKPQIVLIVRMSNGQIIAGYSEPPFKPKSNVDFRAGFMFAFKNKKIFTVKKEPTTKFNKTQPKPITYDDFFLMWGNSDIRIKSGTNELYSGYATANCCYEERGNENSVVDDLFLQEDRETTLEDYELFQVQFQDGDNIW